MRAPATAWASLATVVAFAMPGCREGSPANASPTVSISRSPDGLLISGVTVVVFTAAARDADGDALSVTWDLGDGQKASGASVVHVYARDGVFPVALTVSDGHGGVTTVGSSITAGNLSGRWLLSEGGGKFYERGVDAVPPGPPVTG